MSDKMKPEILREHVIHQLDSAIEKGHIKVYYQPVVRTITNEVCSMEALARWDDPQYGLLSPAIFIPALEEAKLIHRLDTCIIETICAQYAARQRLKRKIVPISFNLSRLDFQLCDIHSVIETAIRDNKLPRDIFHVEITESMMENDEDRMREVIDRFWDSGLRVWMDDFGSGYSSLNVLKDYQFDTLKIDMLFMRDFDARAREIIRSIVDMAKRIGVHTLAEGVETDEQLNFLRSIGCEKAQGYFIGKPMPYDECIEHLRENRFMLEDAGKTQYYNHIGNINVLSPTPLILSADDETNEAPLEAGQVSLAVIETSGRRMRYLFANEHYMHTLRSIGVVSLRDVEQGYEDSNSVFGRKCKHLFQKAKRTGTIEVVNFVRNGKHCFAQVRHVADYPGGSAYACVLQNISTDVNTIKDNLLAEYANDLFSLYEEIEVIDLNTGYSQNIYMATQYLQEYNKLPVAEELRMFAEQQLYPEDKERFLTFMDLNTVEQRLNESPAPFISAPFRILTIDGNYVWRLNIFLYARDRRDRKILCCSRLIDNNNIPVLQQANLTAKMRNARQNAASAGTLDEKDMTAMMLWNNLVQNSSFKFFWKDQNRRFMGASRSFLDYYGIASEAELIGKNDEDMGWHVDPQPYKSDEELILEEGTRTVEVEGHCLNQGEIRDIVASKMPIYDDGQIVGLIGCFRDVTVRHAVAEERDAENIQMSDGQPEDALQRAETIDPHTGMLNFLGIFNAMLKYQESYQKQELDFGIIYLNIENFREYNKNHGVEWGDTLLRTVGQALRKYVGITGVVARYSGDHFMVLSHCDSVADLEKLLEKIEIGVRGIKTVDNIPCTIYFKKGIARYSEVYNLQALYNLAEERSRV
ncbi:MAG: EAL domain-containing protein [Lachnospiraceae bacterium]|nr:EAL domain-containing protein [Lachnospiraceae bacterium]